MTKEEVPKTLVVRLPEPLRKKKIRDAIGIAIHYVGLVGENPTKVPQGELKCARLNLSEEARETYAVAIRDFENTNELVLLALAWVAEQPVHVQMTRI